MRLADAAERVFARHETFHPRYGWFRKAYAAAAEDPNLFSHSDASLRLGVGKNMVRAIRFWGLAAKIISEHRPEGHGRGSQIVPSQRGRALFGPGGWDPYMEDPGTVWLLHWLLLAPPSLLPLWWTAFNTFDAVEFEHTDLEAFSAAQIRDCGWNEPRPSSLRKDILALTRSYAPPEAGSGSIDDLLDCPLRETALLGRTQNGRWRFTLGPKPRLPARIAAATALDYADRVALPGRTVTVATLADEPGSVGRAFRLNETELLDVLRPATERCDRLGLASAAGVWQLTWDGPAAEVSAALLDDYYGQTPAVSVSGLAGDRPASETTLWHQPRPGDAAEARP